MFPATKSGHLTCGFAPPPGRSGSSVAQRLLGSSRISSEEPGLHAPRSGRRDDRQDTSSRLAGAVSDASRSPIDAQSAPALRHGDAAREAPARRGAVDHLADPDGLGARAVIARRNPLALGTSAPHRHVAGGRPTSRTKPTASASSATIIT